MTDERRVPGRRPRRIALRILLATVAAAAAFELAARFLLFSSLAADWTLAAELRRPERLAHAEVEDLYWILLRRFTDPDRELGVPDYDPLVGWLGGWIEPAGRRHREADTVGERRPVLLYGDSFAACVVPEGGCFQDVLERGPLGATHRLLNHGVGGFGLDQIALLLDATVEGYAGRDPLVVVGLLVDDDLDRCALSFRGWPKPRIERRGAGWDFEPAPVPREAPELPLRGSYGLRLLAHGGGVPDGLHDLLCARERLEHENRARCAALFDWTVARLEERGVEFFFLLFHNAAAVERPEASGWREPFAIAALERLGVPWASTRGALRSHARASGRPVSDYYGANGHLNPLGNEVAFRALADGIRGHPGRDGEPAWTEAELAGPLTPDRIAAIVPGGPDAAARYEYGMRPPFERPDERSRLCFRASSEGPTDVRYDLGGRVAAFEASVRFIPLADLGPGEGSVGLTFLADGEELLSLSLARGEGPLPVRVELAGRAALTVRVDDGGDGARGDWLVLVRPVFLGPPHGPSAEATGR